MNEYLIDRKGYSWAMDALKAAESSGDVSSFVHKIADVGIPNIMLHVILSGWTWALTEEGDKFWLAVYNHLRYNTSDIESGFDREVSDFVTNGTDMDLLEFIITGFFCA